MGFIFTEVKRVLPVLLAVDLLCVPGAWMCGALDYRVFVGIGYGTRFSLLYCVLLGFVVRGALERPPKQAKRFLQINYAGRYLLLGAILSVAFLSEHVNPWCVCAAFLAPKLTYTLIGFRDFLRVKLGLPERKAGKPEKTDKMD